MKKCPSCGFPLDDFQRAATCPKCDEDLVAHRAERLMVVDVAHAGETEHAALHKLERAVSECLWHGHAGLKVIHGYGSTSGRSSLKPRILSAMRRHAEMIGGSVEPDGGNPGAHILRFR